MRLVIIAALLVPITALAQSNGPIISEDSTCTTDGDCLEGMVCEEVAAMGCVSPDCRPEGECPDVDPCTPEVVYACIPGPCESDDDCAEGLMCLSFTWTECASQPPDDLREDPAPPPPQADCDQVTVQVCAPPWVGECEVEADCGEGFLCVEAEACSCSGSATTNVPDPDPGNTPPQPNEDDCSCEPSGRFFCELIEQTCVDDGDCLEDWTCEPQPENPVLCRDAPGEEPVCEEPADPGPDMCMPPLWDLLEDAADLGGERVAADPTTANQNAAGYVPDVATSDTPAGCAAVATPVGLIAALALVRRRRR